MLTARPVFLFYPQKSCPLTGKSGQLCSILPVPAHTLKADGKAIQTIFHPGKEGYDEKIYAENDRDDDSDGMLLSANAGGRIRQSDLLYVR